MSGSAGCRGWIPALLLFFGILIPGRLMPLALASETVAAKPVQGPMVIKSKSLEMDDRKKEVVFIGSVHATRDDFEVECERMLIRYEEAPKAGEMDLAEARIKEIVATGNVVIRRAQGGVATAAKAVFSQGEERVVLTGNPSVKQGNDLVEGERITIFLRENRSIVEGSPDNRVKAVIFPRDKGK